MQGMYPSDLDNRRVFAAIFTHLLEAAQKEGREQQQVADDAGIGGQKVQPPEIAHLKNYHRERPNRVALEPKVLQVLAWGLKLSPDRTAALAWLHSPEKITREAVERYTARYSRGSVTAFNEGYLYSEVLKWLTEIYKESLLADGKPLPAQIHLYFDAPPDLLQGDKALLDMENYHGLQYMVTAKPSYMSHPRSAFESGELLDPYPYDTPEEREAARKNDLARKIAWENNIRHYGERGIHSKEAIERALYHPRDAIVRQTRNHYLEVIDLLRNRKEYHYEVGLVEKETPDLETEIKWDRLMMRGRPQGDGEERAAWGPRYIEMKDRPARRLWLDMEFKWASIPRHMRDRDEVADWFEKILRESARVLRPQPTPST